MYKVWFLFLPAYIAFAGNGTAQCSVDYTTMNNFCDLDSLFLTAVPTSGTGPFTFIWETGETTQTISIPLEFGDYMVTMTDATGCVAIINCHIKAYPQVLSYPFNQNACEGDTVTLFLDWFRDSIPGAEYLWSTGETTPTIQITDDITWSVTVTDPATGCEFIIPPSFFEFHYTPWPTIVGPNFMCNGESIILSVEGGPFGTILWWPYWIYEPTLEVVEPGEYIVWTSSPTAEWCWHQDTIVITEGDMPPPELTGPPALCTGQNGEVVVTNSANYIGFSWSNGESTSSIEVNQPGTYTVTVTSAGGCTASESLTIQENLGPQGSLTPTAATCGLSNGSIDLALDPPQNCTYVWSTGATSQDIINVPPGAYQVTVTDVNGCSSVMESNIPDQIIDIVIQEVIVPNSLCNGFNGSIDISVLPVENYSYTWSNGAATQDISELGPGAYSVTVTTGLTCTATDDFEIEDISNAADINPLITPATCGLANGAITLQLSGGSAPFTYSWSNGEIAEELNDIGPGNYGVTVTGADGCMSYATMTVPNEEIVIEIQAEIFPNTSCSESNGAIDISITPVEDYTYAWSNGANTEDLVQVGAGTYLITVSIGNTCMQTASFIVTNENIPFAISGITTPNVSCTTPTGTIDLNISPADVYAYAWSNGSSNEDLQNLGAGVYEVTVTNSADCSITSAFIIEEMISPFLISGAVIHNTSCQLPNGSLDISVDPAGAYSFVWSNGMLTEDLQEIGAGNYSVTVTDQYGCTADTSFNIQDNSTSFSLSAVSVPNSSCIAANGSIDLTISPAGAYEFIWSNGDVAEDLQNISAGVYSVVVTDVNQCTGIDTFLVEDATPAMMVSAILNEDTCLTGTGSIALEVVPSGNTFLWSNGDANEDLQLLSAGTYIVTITNVSGCVAIDTFTVGSVNTSFTVTGVTTPNSSCFTPDGSIDVSVSPAGNYSFLWTNGSITEDLQLLDSGVYSVTVSDGSGCFSMVEFSIDNAHTALSIDVQVEPAKCGHADGSIDLNVTPSAGNTYSWSNGSNLEDISDVAGGSYTVTITNGSGCDTILVIEVPDTSTSFSAIGVVQAVSSCVSPDGGIDLQMLPIGAYSFLWSTSEVTEDLAGLSPGVYSVTIADEFGCAISNSFIIADETIFPEATASIEPATCGQLNGSINLTISSAVSYTILWSTGEVAEDIASLSAGTYIVTVTTEKGCALQAPYVVPNQHSNFTIASVTANETSCVQANGSIDLTVTPAASYTFLWSNGATTEDLQNLSSGIYEVTVTDQAMCSAFEVFAIEQITTLPEISGIVTPATCGNPNGSIAISVVPANVQEVQWNTGETTEDLVNLVSGTYSVTVTDDAGCTASSSFVIPSSAGINVEIQADLSGLGSGVVACSLQLNVPMNTIASIQWTPDEMMSCHNTLCTEQNISILARTEIQAMVTDINGCTGFASLVLDVDKEFKVYIPNVFTPGNDGQNNRFTVYANKEIEEVVILEIFDRWGNNVFIKEEFPPNDPQHGWDGVYKGKLMNPAVYVYQAVVRYSNGELHDYSGDVTLVR